MTTTHYTIQESPVGPLLLGWGDDALTLLIFQKGKKARQPDLLWKLSTEPFGEVIRQLNSYFAGELQQFDLPLAPAGTPFQLRVWEALRSIPFGQTISYGELARRIGQPTAVRAVGAANGRNPLPIVIPCHRVIGSDGSLTGFGGGLPAKKHLLALEKGQREFSPAEDAQLVLL